MATSHPDRDTLILSTCDLEKTEWEMRLRRLRLLGESEEALARLFRKKPPCQKIDTSPKCCVCKKKKEKLRRSIKEPGMLYCQDCRKALSEKLKKQTEVRKLQYTKERKVKKKSRRVFAT